MIHLLTVSGSLRAGSSNVALLAAAVRLAPEGVNVAPFTGIAEMPAFSPDVDVEPAPESVVAWRMALANADGVVLSSPEYAHGMPGALKNALDWVVGSGELYGKPVALLNPSPESLFAHPQLAEVLRTMGAEVVEPASITVRVPRGGASVERIVDDADIAHAVQGALTAFVGAIASRQS